MDSKSVDQLRSVLGQYPRMHGYYLLNFVALPSSWREDEEASLSQAFGALHDKPWPPSELRPKDQLWKQYEVDESIARAEVVAALVGGKEVGHSHKTVPESTAQELWKQFRGLFSLDTRFFVRVGLGNPAYVFQQGAIAVDDQKAGCLCVIEND